MTALCMDLYIQRPYNTVPMYGDSSSHAGGYVVGAYVGEIYTVMRANENSRQPPEESETSAEARVALSKSMSVV